MALKIVRERKIEINQVFSMRSCTLEQIIGCYLGQRKVEQWIILLTDPVCGFFFFFSCFLYIDNLFIAVLVHSTCVGKAIFLID